MFPRLRCTLIFATVIALLVLAHPATARASGCACFYTHVNTSLGYVSTLDDSPNWDNSNLLFATINGSGGAPVDAHPIGVWYNTNASRWTVYNEDIHVIPQNAQFNVYAPVPLQSSDYAAYTHVTTSSNTAGDSTALDNAVLNGNPNASLLVSAVFTANYPVYDTHQLGVWYWSQGQKWEIFHEDKSPMPVGAAYFVEASIGSTGNWVSADANHLQNGQVVLNAYDPSSVILITQDWGSHGVYNNHPVGVTYNTSTGMWAIYNVDGTPIPAGAMFFYDIP